MKYKNLRLQLLIIIMLMSSFVLGIVGFYNYEERQELLYKISNEKLVMMMKLMRKSQEDEYLRYSTRLNAISMDEKFQSAVLAKDIKEIESYLLKKYFLFKSVDKNFKHFHFYDDSANFIPMHLQSAAPNYSYDNFVVTKALKGQKLADGFVTSNDGKYYFSLVKPIIIDTKVIGYLEAALEADYNLNIASKIGRYKYALYLNKHSQTQENRRVGELSHTNFSFFKNNDITQEYIHKFANQNRIIEYASKYYLLNQYDIETPDQKNFGQSLLLNNVTDAVKENRRHSIVFIVFSILMLIIEFIIIYRYVTKFIEKLNKHEVKLLAQKDEIQLIMDNSENFIALYEDNVLSFVNSPFLYFFNIGSLEVFIERYESIELLFEELEDSFTCRYAPNDNWMQEIQRLDIKERIVAIKHNNKEMHYFHVNISTTKDKENFQIVTFSEVTELYTGARKDKYDARHDSLTKIYNRKYFDEYAKRELEKANEGGYTFSIVMFDIDYFKKVNDTYGHQVGDNVLVKLTKLVSKHIRSSDIFARWGGEEFVILLSGSDIKAAKRISENLRVCIENGSFEDVKEITCSFGVSEFTSEDTLHKLTLRVDSALYSAKESGRNRVEVI